MGVNFDFSQLTAAQWRILCDADRPGADVFLQSDMNRLVDLKLMEKSVDSGWSLTNWGDVVRRNRPR